jgi:SNF2 family DNA or RNA helicase
MKGKDACGAPCQGLLGDARAFKAEYVKPITAGSDKHATERSRALAAGRAAGLRAALAPFFLRREKGQVLGGAAR